LISWLQALAVAAGSDSSLRNKYSTRRKFFFSAPGPYTFCNTDTISKMAIIDLQKPVIVEILSYITDQRTLANVALAWKTLFDAVLVASIPHLPGL